MEPWFLNSLVQHALLCASLLFQLYLSAVTQDPRGYYRHRWHLWRVAGNIINQCHWESWAESFGFLCILETCFLKHWLRDADHTFYFCLFPWCSPCHTVIHLHNRKLLSGVWDVKWKLPDTFLSLFGTNGRMWRSLVDSWLFLSPLQY